MSSTAAAPALSPLPASHEIVPQGSELAPSVGINHTADAQTPRRAGFGLPCASCKTYYSADLKACPVCKASERVSAVVAPARKIAAESTISDPQETPTLEVLEAERERFLQEFKAQLLASGKSSCSSGKVSCVHKENHPNGPEAASVCQSCHDYLQERIDALESALRIDLKEATQIVYDAVWADPSDPAKTYENAAQALLTELRKRSGVTPTFELLQS
jgi:RNA polymerase subunit RPABC4/transcription elongation factor Spt4